jgi:hypothetical protein
MKNKKGISLIILVITIIVIVILAVASILLFMEGGIFDKAKKAKFMNNFRSVEDGVNLYAMGSLKDIETLSYTLPVLEKLTLDEKQQIENNVPTLNTKILELNQGKTLANTDLYWIDLEISGASSLPKDRKYIIDISTRQIYDYVGDVFEGKRWHTLDGGVIQGDVVKETEEVDEMWDGWIKLTLYYPSGATNKKWRLGAEGEVRSDDMLVWQDYTGPITIPLDRTKDVWISYNLNGQEVIIPPAGTLLVDIAVDNTGSELVEKVNVKITYDANATIKLYKVGNSDWMEYTGEFEVTENCLIQAKAKKAEEIYNQDGTLLMTRNLAGSDAYYVKNIGIKEIEGSLVAPTITRLDPQNENEKARVLVTYPEGAVKKVYKINYGEEIDYTSEIGVQKYGTHIMAYYYNAEGKKSNVVAIIINDTSEEEPNEPKPHEPLPPTVNKPNEPDPNDVKYYLVAPTITRLEPVNAGEKARVQITYPSNASKLIYNKNGDGEQTYSNVIPVTEWGTYIIAYYYDVNGELSQASWIRINQTPTPAEPYPPMTLDPKDIIQEPEIVVNPTTIATETVVSVNSPANADKVYIKLGRYGSYQEYTSSITVRQNMEVYAYYVTYDGEKSEIARKVIKNIRGISGGSTSQPKPYVYIDALPYPWSGSYTSSAVKVTILYSDADKIEYSEDGIIYKAYTNPFDVTENKRIYARGTNTYGVTETYLDITNIKKDGEVKPPEQLTKLSVAITVDPEPLLSETKVAKAKVMIEYDSRATEKYYKIGAQGELQTYTAPFEITENDTIYAYAKGEKAKGSASKKVDNLLDGIAQPEITVAPNNNITASKVNININYDKYANIKRYSINGGQLRDYAEEFEVTENGTVIYAYSENVKGQKSESTYVVNNIVKEPPVLLLDKGDYYILKLNYPEKSKGREYKWKVDGEWKPYKEAGILLIKPQFKDNVIKNGTLVKIEDENGERVTFTGDYYLIDVPISELFENISMRWDRTTPSAPQILLNTTEPAKQITATIVYNDSLIKKQYRILEPGGEIGEWKDYTDPISIYKNNTTIYAKGMDDAEVWSQEGIKKVTNIDENPPVINLTADLETATQSVSVRVSVTDDVEVGDVKWAQGVLGENYFANNGTQITNNTVVKITSNGYYTFYAEDKVGNKQVYTLNVTNVDLTAPNIDIQVADESTFGLTTNVSIDYGDSTLKQYKIGASNATWTNYTTTFAVSSYTVISKNWQNADDTVTVYAKGKDSAGNEQIVQKKIINLDLDIPIAPVINSTAGYPVLTLYGVNPDSTTVITYDTRTDIDNYYSVDNGVTWIKYVGQFDFASGTIIAKSVKKTTGLEVSVSKAVTKPSDAMSSAAYDKNDSTYMGTIKNTSAENTIFAKSKYIKVNEDVAGKKIRVKFFIFAPSREHSNSLYIRLLNSANTILNSIYVYVNPTYYLSKSQTKDEIIEIPSGTEKISGVLSSANSGLIQCGIYEIQLANEPIFSVNNNKYALLNSKGVIEPYQLVNIEYFSTSVQRLYKIGESGVWLNYIDQLVKVKQGEIIYAKGIDKYGNETRIISSYTANISDALRQEAYDGNYDTYDVGSATGKYMNVDSSMWGKQVRIKWFDGTSYNANNLIFLNSQGTEISRLVSPNVTTTDTTYTIPTNTVRIKMITTSASYAATHFYLYEIEPVT